MKTKIKKKIETVISISKKDAVAILRKEYPEIPDDCHLSHIESDDGDDVVGLEITYYETE